MADRSGNRLACLGVRILCLALCLLSGASRAAVWPGEAYVEVYNILAQMTIDRCLAVGVTNMLPLLKDTSPCAGSCVWQQDLQFLREKVLFLMNRYYIAQPPARDLTNNCSSDVALSPYACMTERFPCGKGLMEGIGEDGQFTKVPGQYTRDGRTVYTNRFTEVPILREHLEELYRALTNLTCTRHVPSWSSLSKGCCLAWGPIDSLEALKAWGESSVGDWAESQDQPYACTELFMWWSDAGGLDLYRLRGGRYIGTRKGRYQVSGLCTNFPHTVSFWNYARCWGEPPTPGIGVSSNMWHMWSQVSGQGSGAISSWLGYPDLPPWCTNIFQPEPGEEAACSRGFEVLASVAVVEYEFPSYEEQFMAAIEKTQQTDYSYDGLAYAGCPPCSDGYCSETLQTVSWKAGASGAKSSATIPLGHSSVLARGGLQVKAYLEEYFMFGQPRQMFSLDTGIIDIQSSWSEGWKFATLKRPSGAEVIFSFKDGDVGYPINVTGVDYVMKEIEYGLLEVEFPASDYVVHRFYGWGPVDEIFWRKNEDVRVESPWSEVGLTIEPPDDWTITRVESPILIAELVYDGDCMARGVVYKDRDGNPIESVDTLPGSRVYRRTDAQGNILDETRIVTHPTNGITEIWRGVVTEPALTAARKEIRQETYDLTNGVTTIAETVVLNPGMPGETRHTNLVLYKRFPWGREVIREEAGSGSSVPQVTYYSYYTNAAEAANYGRLKLVERPDGSWSRYEYDAQRRETVIAASFRNSSPDADYAACRVTRRYYPGDPALDALGFPSDVTFAGDRRPRLIIEEVLGTEVSRTYHAFFKGSNITKQCVSAGASWNDPASLVTVTHDYTDGDGIGRVQRIERPEGTLTTYTYSYDAQAGQLTTISDSGEGWPIVTNGTRTLSVVDEFNNTLYAESRDIASGAVVSKITNTYDSQGHLLVSSNVLDGTCTAYEYDCCGMPRLVRSSDGITTEYVYDSLKRKASATALGATTSYGYDSHGNVSQVRKTAPGCEPIVTASVYDEAGRLVATTNELGQTTTYSYSMTENQEKVVTTTYPDGSTRIETYYRDGQLKSVSGSAAQPRFYDYGVDEDGLYTIEYLGSNAEATAWVKTWVNMLGQTWKTAYPDGYTQVTVFDDKGRPVRYSDGFTTTLTAYNGNGEPWLSATDMNGNDQIDRDGNDRVTETLTSYTTFEGKDVRKTVTRAYATTGASTPTELSTQLAAVDGSKTWSVFFGRTSVVEIARDPSTASRTETVTQPDGTQRISFYTNNLLMAVIEKDALGSIVSWRSMTYDAFGRLNTSSEPAANGEIRTTTYEYDAAGNVTSTVVSAGSLSQITTYVYDNMGRRIRTVLPDGGVVNYVYSSRGELIQQSGARTYPVTYAYDDQGRMAAMSTYRDGPNGSPDTTTWQYDPQRGWMTSRTYADGSRVSYEYFPNGSLRKRTWARGIETTYSYDAAGSLIHVDYSDATPDVSYVLDRLGRQVEITDGLGTWTNTYTEDGQLASIAIPFPCGWSLSYTRDPLGRLTNAVLSHPVSSFEFPVSYSFDPAGRLASISGGPTIAEYAFSPDGRTWTNLSLGSTFNVARTFDGLNRLLSTLSISGTCVVHSSSYSYNLADQRTTNVLADGSYWVYQYDELGQVVSGKKYFADGTPVGGCQFEYEFDTIGNRKVSYGGARSVASSYVANELNQYEARTVPGKVLVTGEAREDAAVSARWDTNRVAQMANRHGEYFWTVLGAANEGTLVATTNLEIRACVAEGSNSLVRLETRSVIVPQTPEEFTYDADGNLLSDGLWSYTWNGENRLIAMESISAVPNPMKKRVTFDYDYQGRRVRKTVESGYAAGAYATTNITAFVWDGWLPIAELGAGFTNVHLYGLDLRGTLQGAGGVGGLLAVSHDGATYFAAYDGNGNITDYVDTNGAVVAHREYDPFGGTIALTGGKNDVLHFWFSTRYTDEESGLVVYPARPYSPTLGRFLSRDPADRAGGPNLQAFLSNSPVNDTDPYGLWGEKTHLENTRDWAKVIGFRDGAAADIGHEDNAVDSGETSFWPWPFGDPSYHFDRTPGSADSRLQHYGRHLSKAKDFCNWNGSAGQDDWENALKQLGLALHPVQDWVAHGDFYGAVPHNMFSPQSTLGVPREKIAAVDNEEWDAKDGPDGRPAGAGFHVAQGNEYAWFITGSKRITKTKQLTDYALQTFLDHIRRHAKPCGACRAYFLRDNDPHRYQ